MIPPLRPVCILGRRMPLRLFRAQIHTSSALWAKRKTIQQFRLADIGEGITECEVIKWIVKPAGVVQSFDPLCEVQSDKASVEITSPFEGVVKELLVKEGDVAKVGEGLCLIEVEEDNPEDASTPTPEIPDPSPSVEKVPSKASQPEQSPVDRRLHPLDPSRKSDLTLSSRDVLATPSVRHFARQNGVDLAAVGVGSGKGGRIEKRDIEAFLSPPPQSELSTAHPEIGNEFQVELGRTRFAMWKAMTKSLEIPHFGYSTTLDLTRLSKILPTLNAHIPRLYSPPASGPSIARPPAVSPHAILPQPPAPVESDPSMHYTRLTFLPLLLKTLSRAMVEWPLFRSSLFTMPDPSSKQKPTLTVRPHADITIALSTPTGLYTPTLTAVDTLSSYSIMGRLRRLQHLGRQIPCALGPAEMPKRGGTITVSNIGAIGKGEFAAPLLFPGGGVAIAAIGKAKWVDIVPEDGIGAIERRLLVSVSWSADHRIVEGAEMAAFVETWRQWVEYPERLIGDSL